MRDKTRSVWDYFLSRKEQFLNDKYDGTIDDNVRGNERMIFPQVGQVRWWSDAFGRTDAEMNGAGLPPPTGQSVEEDAAVLTGVETADSATGIGAPGKAVSNGATGGISALTAGVSSLGIRHSFGGRDSRSVTDAKAQLEVEMQ